MNPLVSVIIPTYNAERFVGRALKSALTQTHESLEIVVVDDGSTDATQEMVCGLRDPRIVYLWQENAGQGRARNNGIASSKGDYLTFLDADDYYYPNKVEKQVQYLLANPQYQVVYCNALHYRSDAPERFFKKRGTYRSGNIMAELLRTSFINPNTVMVAREVLQKVGGFNETRYYPEDWDLWLRIALAGHEFGYLDEDLAVVELRHDSNTTMDIQWILKANAIAMFERLFRGAAVVDGRTYRADSIIRNLKFKLAISFLVNGRRKEFMQTFVEMFPLKPLAYMIGGVMVLLPPTAYQTLWRLNQIRHSQFIHPASHRRQPSNADHIRYQ